MATFSIIVIAGCFLVGAVLGYNGLVRARHRMREGWSGIEVQLKMRHDLVPNLVVVARSYAGHEKRMLEDVVRAREAGLDARAPADVQDAEGGLTRGLVSVLCLAEAYPDLKADETFLQLQRDLFEVEERIQMARRYFNGTVREYNIRVESFPSNLVAAVFRFETAAFFELESASARVAPQMEF